MEQGLKGRLAAKKSLLRPANIQKCLRFGVKWVNTLYLYFTCLMLFCSLAQEFPSLIITFYFISSHFIFFPTITKQKHIILPLCHVIVWFLVYLVWHLSLHTAPLHRATEILEKAETKCPSRCWPGSWIVGKIIELDLINVFVNCHSSLSMIVQYF